jgi:hypothetical protein
MAQALVKPSPCIQPGLIQWGNCCPTAFTPEPPAAAAPTAAAAAAAYGGHEAVADLGNQIFITMRKGTCWPPAACDIRVRYDQTIGDLKAAVSAQMGIPVEQQQLFWHKKELTAAYDERTLLDMNMHTGFAIKGYDLVSWDSCCSLAPSQAGLAGLGHMGGSEQHVLLA